MKFTICTLLYIYSGTVALSRYNDLLQAGQSGDRIPVVAIIQRTSRPVLGLTQPPIQCVFPGNNKAGAWR
jgi:hypothetical protein